MLVVIELCESNPIATENLETLETEYPGVAVLRNSCLNECVLCALTPYVMINGDIVQSDTVEKLLEQIRDKVVIELKQWED